MKRKKLFALGLVLLLTFTFVAPTFASQKNFNNVTFNGRAYYSFFSTYKEKDSSETWDTFSCTIDSVTYVFPDFNNCKVHVKGSDGSVISSAAVISSGGSATLTKKTGADNRQKARFQIFNMDYLINGNHDNEMHATGRGRIAHN